MELTVWTYEGTIEAQAALKLLALLYPRPGELRLSHWSEFDFEERIWTIPADRTKTRKLHRKPLPAPASANPPPLPPDAEPI